MILILFCFAETYFIIVKINFQFLLCQHPLGSIIYYNIQCITELIIFLLNPRLNSKTKDYYGYRLKKLKYLNIIATQEHNLSPKKYNDPIPIETSIAL